MTYPFRILADDDYLELLGRAVYNFAIYEWAVVWTSEKLKPGSLDESKTMTARRIAGLFAKNLDEYGGSLEESQLEQLREAHQQFSQLIERRDQLIHAHPITALDGKQQLFYVKGIHPEAEWPSEQVEQAAIEFENAAIALNDLFHTFWPTN